MVTGTNTDLIQRRIDFIICGAMEFAASIRFAWICFFRIFLSYL